MITVIAHFRDEEYLLPWWLDHHRSIFDHGILIDHGSTDRSVEICKHMVGHWKVIPTKLSTFDSIDNEFEVMGIETEVSGWKMALNISEFLVAGDLRARLLRAERNDIMAIRSQGAVMVDVSPETEPLPDQPLVRQKYTGYIEEGWRLGYAARQFKKTAWRRRLIHRYPHGAYHPGRHSTFRHVDEKAKDIFTLWYGFAPWSDAYLRRKLSFANRISTEDKKAGRGLQHLRGRAVLDAERRRLAWIAYDLRPRIFPD